MTLTPHVEAFEAFCRNYPQLAQLHGFITEEHMDGNGRYVGLDRKGPQTASDDTLRDETPASDTTQGFASSATFVGNLSPEQLAEVFTLPPQGLELKFANAEIETNEHGGKQSRLEAAYHLLDPIAMERLAHVVWYGNERYPADPDGTPNWHHIPWRDNLNHALYHLFQALSNDTTEDHLGHAFARVMFAIRTQHNERNEQ